MCPHEIHRCIIRVFGTCLVAGPLHVCPNYLIKPPNLVQGFQPTREFLLTATPPQYNGLRNRLGPRWNSVSINAIVWVLFSAPAFRVTAQPGCADDTRDRYARSS